MTKYKQLAQKQRYQIAALKQEKKSQSEIARKIGVDKSTVSRELKRNKSRRGYRPKRAHEVACERQEDWSPEQVSGFLKKEKDIKISYESIYLFVLKDKADGGTLHLHLRRGRKKYKKRYGKEDRRGMIANKKSIEERPKIVDEKTRIGDWEMDLISGAKHQGFLVTVVERKSKLTLISYVKNKSAAAVCSYYYLR